MSKYKFILVSMFLIACIIVSIILHKKTERYNFSIDKHITRCIANCYAWNQLLLTENVRLEYNGVTLSELLKVGDLTKTQKHDGFNPITRSRLFCIARKLDVQIGTYQSNASLFGSIFDEFFVRRQLNENVELKIVIKDFELYDESMMIDLILFNNYTNSDDLEIFENGNQIEPNVLERYEKDISKLSIRVTNPATCNYKDYQPN